MRMPRPGVLEASKSRILALSLVAFVLLTIRFSPNWIEFGQLVQEVRTSVVDEGQRAAVEKKAILSGYSERGFYVVQQERDLRFEIADSKHKIVRWRLLVPALGHLLRLPSWLLLGLAQIGCLLLVVTLVGIGVTRPAVEAVSQEGFCLGIVGGASAPFFTSMGLLGYYDSWLALALLGVAFARSRWLVWLACLLGPWIDERFVLGLPLALCVRRFASDSRDWSQSRWWWFDHEALAPTALAVVYVVVRLKLGGTGGSQTVNEYFSEFVVGKNISAWQRVIGAWEGLRFGWVLVAAAVWGAWKLCPAIGRLEAWLLTAGVILTGVIGLFTALDLGRSMVLLIPVVPLGGIAARQWKFWRKSRLLLLLALAALFLPARHVVGKESRPVDSWWAPSQTLVTTEGNLGMMYEIGEDLPKDRVQALRWFRRGAAHGGANSQHNLGAMYGSGEGVPPDPVEAARWYHLAAEQGFPVSEYYLARAYVSGEGVDRDAKNARYWFSRAADHGYVKAQYELGLIYSKGVGGPRDFVQAYRWLEAARNSGMKSAQDELAAIENEMTPAQIAEARKQARSSP